MAISDTEFSFVQRFIREEAGIVIETDKRYLVEFRLASVVSQEGLQTLQDLLAQMQRGASKKLQQAVVDAITTNETSFFRDIQPFEALRTQVIPKVIAARSSVKQLNIWCAASSTGQEPYSMAMMLDDKFPELATWRVTHIATDICTEVLAKAKSGRFTQLEMNRGLPVPYLVKYFEKQGLEWQLKEKQRRSVTFREFNLHGLWTTLPPMDIIMMRNVLIYFDLESKRAILKKIRQLLRPDGYLFLGSSEMTMNIDDKFERVALGRTSCYRVAAEQKIAS
jgi:chemotaxis protein methyltransferase CheR